MKRLYLLGFTHDLKGVVFAQRRGARTATFWVPIDGEFGRAVEKLEGARNQRSGKPRGGRAGDQPKEPLDRRSLPPVGRSQARSGMPASEIQQLLREGKSAKSVADVAKTSLQWVERLGEPVLAERVGVVRLAQRAFMPRPRLGPSGLPVGEAVLRNLEGRRATPDTIDGLGEAWDARTNAAGTWRVTLRFAHRGKRRTAVWEFKKATRQITARNRLAAQLGWWPAEAGDEPEPVPVDDEEVDDEIDEEPVVVRRGPTSTPKKRRKPARRAQPPKGAARLSGRKPSGRGSRSR